MFNAFFNAAFLLGPGIGGLLATTGYASAFIGAALFRLMAVVIVVFAIHPQKHSTHITTHKEKKLSYKALFILPLIGAYILAFGDYLYLGFDQTLMPIWMHDHLGASVAVIGIVYMLWAIPNMLISPFSGRFIDRLRHRSWLILLCGLAQVPLYITYGLANTALLVAILFAVHGIVYAFMQPAVDTLVASSSVSYMRGRVQGLYATVGLIGAFAGASGFSPLYALNFRLPLFAMGTAFGICVLIGSTLIRISELKKTQ